MVNSKKTVNQGAVYADKLIHRAVYDALYDVFVNGAYCARAITTALKKLKEQRAHAFVTSAFYGVLDKNVRLEKLISSLCDRPPQKNAEVLLKLGLYYVGYADMPVYAAVNSTVELSKSIGGVFGGFINAVLKKSVDYVPKFKSTLEKFSYDHCTPEWLCKMLISDYSETRAAGILDAELPSGTHVRPVKGRMTDAQFSELSKGLDSTEYGCYCDKAALDKFESGTYAVQSLSSVKAVRTYVKGITGGAALDLCAAPGGKSVYLYELGDFKITACDIYPHKIDLMRGYAKKLGAKVSVKLNDATVYNNEFDSAFDLVIADCPCSGTGTLKSKPDILLRRKPSDLAELNGLQTKILDAASKYPKRGGVLCYSTCSVLKCENESITKEFLSAHSDYKLLDETKLMPDVDACDGFYIA
ncbi:MAG: methyltransferase domain-containing protein, partial [Clostridiales bacterium]|nr:methyltransferase domain-containing protein [Clostridiales bacterium]